MNGLKIGIITFHRARNVGACLQTYALEFFLSSMGAQPEIIDFVPNSEVVKRSFIRKCLHFAKTALYPKIRRIIKKQKKYDSFRKKYLIISKKTYFGDYELLNSSLEYSVLISGSDQILNLTLSDYSFSYYLPFKSIPKISYGSSFGRNSISDIEKWAILKYLPSFSALSFREESGFNIVNSLIEVKKKNIVVDPVFLISKEQWKAMCKKRKKREYIIVYAMEKSEWLEKTINKVANENNHLDLIVLYGSNFDMKIYKRHKSIYSPDPILFLSLMNEASIIITNSFHGLAFSFLFEKKVYCCSHSTRNVRLESLLGLIGEKEKIIGPLTNNFDYIDGQTASAKLDSIIDSSKEYIRISLEGIKND